MQQLYILTSKLNKAASSIGFIKKALHNNVTPTFVQIKRQFVNKHEQVQTERGIMLFHLNRHVCNSKIQNKDTL